MDPTLLRDLEIELKADEGHVIVNGRHVVYDDATGKPLKKGDTIIGNPTAGYGRELSMTGFSDSEVVSLLDDDCIEFTEECADHYSWFAGLPEQAQLVVASVAFNMGIPHFDGFHDTLMALSGHQFSKAADCLLDSDAARELAPRYQHYAQILRSLDRVIP